MPENVEYVGEKKTRYAQRQSFFKSFGVFASGPQNGGGGKGLDPVVLFLFIITVMMFLLTIREYLR